MEDYQVLKMKCKIIDFTDDEIKVETYEKFEREIVFRNDTNKKSIKPNTYVNVYFRIFSQRNKKDVILSARNIKKLKNQ